MSIRWRLFVKVWLKPAPHKSLLNRNMGSLLFNNWDAVAGLTSLRKLLSLSCRCHFALRHLNGIVMVLCVNDLTDRLSDMWLLVPSFTVYTLMCCSTQGVMSSLSWNMEEMFTLLHFYWACLLDWISPSDFTSNQTPDYILLHSSMKLIQLSTSVNSYTHKPLHLVKVSLLKKKKTYHSPHVLSFSLNML